MAVAVVTVAAAPDEARAAAAIASDAAPAQPAQPKSDKAKRQKTADEEEPEPVDVADEEWQAGSTTTADLGQHAGQVQLQLRGCLVTSFGSHTTDRPARRPARW